MAGRALNGSSILRKKGFRRVVGSAKLMHEGVQIEGIMALSDVLMRVVGFLRAGYPEGVPAHDYIPLLALLRRRLSDDEVMAVAAELTSDGT